MKTLQTSTALMLSLFFFFFFPLVGHSLKLYLYTYISICRLHTSECHTLYSTKKKNHQKEFIVPPQPFEVTNLKSKRFYSSLLYLTAGEKKPKGPFSIFFFQITWTIFNLKIKTGIFANDWGIFENMNIMFWVRIMGVEGTSKTFQRVTISH